MKKIRISELPLYNSLKGLFTLGTDQNNRSVKVSLEFIELSTAAADSAAAAARQATTNAQTATNAANKAADSAQTATNNANAATKKADTATENAKAATDKANTAAADATTATNNAKQATQQAQQATGEAQDATQEALQAAIQATKNIPLTLSVEAPARITFGNTEPGNIIATLTPETAPNNIIYLSDNKAVSVDPKGRIKVLAIGVSEVHVIPTLNTDIAKTILIKVEAPTLRLINTRTQIRITGSGDLRLN